MTTQERTVELTGSDTRWLYRVGGISALALGIGYLAIVGLYVPIGAPPNGVEARLAYLAAHTAVWWWILGLSVLTDFLFVPVAFALYLALKHLHRSAMLLGASCIVLFVVLDLALTWTNYAALISLSAQYAAAGAVDARAAILTAASYPAAILGSTLLFVYNTLTLAVGILITGLVMRGGVFARSTAYVGILTGVLGIISVLGPHFVPALGATIILTSILTMVWVMLVGVRLYRLGCG